MNKNNIQKAVEVFNAGGVVVFPTDTAFGIGCRMDNSEAVKRVFEIKKRPFDKALLVLVDSLEMAKTYVKIPDEVVNELLDKYWPGGLTVFLKCNKDKVLPLVTAETNSLAVRLPNHKEILEVISQVGVPIIATSANLSGERTPYELSEVNKMITDNVDYVMEGNCTYKEQSTIVDTTVNPWKTIREGVVKV